LLTSDLYLAGAPKKVQTIFSWQVGPAKKSDAVNKLLGLALEDFFERSLICSSS